MVIGLLTLLALLALVLCFCVARRELLARRSVSRDRPATLEGGGSHLTVRKGK